MTGSVQDWLRPEWPAPDSVGCLVSTRSGGVSTGPFASLNLGRHVGDEPAAVAENRRRLRAALPDEPRWLNQVHGADVVCLDTSTDTQVVHTADAAVTTLRGKPCAVMVADCLPVLFCDEAGTCVAAAHAGWRGLAAGVLEATVAAMPAKPQRLLAYLGPAIGPDAFEVGPEVREIFASRDSAARAAFRPLLERPEKYLADIFALARLRLASAGVDRVYGGTECTFTSPDKYYSYRRDGKTGRMAALIWLQ